MATCARTSGDLLLLTFSLRTEHFHGLLFCTHTSFGHSLYTSDFNGLFYLLLPGEPFLT